MIAQAGGAVEQLLILGGLRLFRLELVRRYVGGAAEQAVLSW